MAELRRITTHGSRTKTLASGLAEMHTPTETQVFHVLFKTGVTEELDDTRYKYVLTLSNRELLTLMLQTRAEVLHKRLGAQKFGEWVRLTRQALGLPPTEEQEVTIEPRVTVAMLPREHGGGS